MKKSANTTPSDKEARLIEQVAMIESVREKTGLNLDQMAEMLAVKPETLRKYANGYQPASANLTQLISLIPERLRSRQEATNPNGIARDKREMAHFSDGSKAGDLTLQQQLGFVVEHAEPGEVVIVRSLIDAAYRQCAKRAKAGDEHQTPNKKAPADDSRRIIRFPIGYQLKPLCGKIPAGLPAETTPQSDQWVAVPPAMAAQTTYVLEVRGNSMIDRDIYDGDLVYIDARREPRNNNVVAALCDHESTLKTYVNDGKRPPFLRSENSQYPSRIHINEECMIQGVMIGKHLT